jgi:uncharacterized repeat protein (TIGR02543 family)
MKKIVLFVMAVMAFAGMSVAQDVWSCGYYTSNSVQQAAVYKNGTKMYNTSFGNNYSGDCPAIDVYGSDVYWVRNCYVDNNFHYADVMKNNNVYLNSPTGEGRHIYDIVRSPNTGSLFSVGCMTVDGVRTAVRWRDNDADPLSQMGNGTYESVAYGATMVQGYSNVYSVGYQYTNASTYHGVIWNGSTVLHDFETGTRILDICYYHGYFWTVGTVQVGSDYTVKVWKTSITDGATQQVYVINTYSYPYPDRHKIYIDDAADIYVVAVDGGYDKLYKNGTELYYTSGYFTSVVANSNGVYYGGQGSNTGRIWKDGSYLYSPSDCSRITGLFIDEPECTDSEIRSLPFTDGFENGNTSWPCWTKIDVDNNNGTNISYWSRLSNGGVFPSLPQPATGDYYAFHQWHPSNAQEGWLISPRLFLQPAQDHTTLSFKSHETSSGAPQYMGVWISTTGTNTSDFTEVWHQTSPSDTWKNVSVDLEAYQGHAVYIAFKFSGSTTMNWHIDDVSVTESFSPCSITAPITYNFSDGFGSCWTAYDADMTGSSHSWAQGWHPYESWECMCHPHGTPSQTGWLYSPRVVLPSGNYNYTLTYKSRNSGNTGTGETHTVWIAVDKTGAYVPADYTQIYSEPDYPTSWTTRTIDLSAYKGHMVGIAFKYTGNDGHTWNIDDFSVSQAIAEYTINVNANNNSWGTVSGGGTYPAGATCTLLATPASGYQFDCWKLNGSVVSNSPQYSFTVTENATYTAYFAETPVVYYTITTEVTPAGSGTVTGGGTHPAGSSITLEAVNNPGWTFAHWQDNNSSNPRTITVTGDATYTATFTQDNYVITTNVSPAGAGTVTGGGAYHYGNVATLTATANSGYEFAGWNDGNTDNPRSITVTQSETYTAFFNEVGTTMYAVTASVNPVGAGTVTGTGTFPAGTVTTLEAVANAGYTFDHWQDGITANPRTVSVNNNMSFTAYFTRNQYIITVVASPSNGGIVSGGGAYYYGDYTTLTAIPNSGYEFVGWSDGSNEPNHTVMVTGNATYTATFAAGGSTYYTVSAYVSPTGAGTVSGTGTFPAGSTTTLTAIANSGYAFDHWNDGSTTNPRTVTVNNNMSFTAYFNSDQYTITVNANPTAGGTVTGGGSYPYGATVTLTATANSGYSFLRWNDGNTSNVRTITVTGNATYTALFMAAGGETYVLTVTSGNPILGQVTGGGIYPAGAPAEIRAIPASYATFLRWNDGNTDNPRTVIMNSDLEFVAEFGAAQTYTITVLSSNEEMGQVFGGGTFVEGSTTEISALAYEGYMFTGWNDGNTDNPRTITVTGNATYTAQFAESSTTTYTLTLICNTSEGTVSGGGVYMAGATAIIQAFPNPGHVFSKWSDENSQNPRIITMNSDMTLVAFFATGVGENEQPNLVVYPNPAKESIRILGIEANTSVAIYNSLGELVKVVSASENQEINVRDLAAGLYMVHFGNATLRFVKEQ